MSEWGVREGKMEASKRRAGSEGMNGRNGVRIINFGH